MLRNRIGDAFAQIDEQLKQRYDLIFNLVEIARGYMVHERTTLEELANARNAAQTATQTAAQNPVDATALTAMAHAEGALAGILGRFFAIAETYPDLKANQNMMQLSAELTTTENEVAFSQQAFNESVMDFNAEAQSFPAVLFAKLLGFHRAALLQPLEAGAEQKTPVIPL
ncbi:MAG: LemA family protein [Candidatus Thiothrix singaporensis]|uniref:LemA family protein n=1 Tax=Candidatus Thiothrix singaporensis TaxID=2799669 RepID=A0A7L6ARI6_9GAMM|nr:MAG: LemA family protein [Candidatus Thiothrix singaporensis]